jgi:hypothetical protein
MRQWSAAFAWIAAHPPLAVAPTPRSAPALPTTGPSLRALRAARRTLVREREVPWFHYQSHFADVFAGGGFDIVMCGVASNMPGQADLSTGVGWRPVIATPALSRVLSAIA